MIQFWSSSKSVKMRHFQSFSNATPNPEKLDFCRPYFLISFAQSLMQLNPIEHYFLFAGLCGLKSQEILHQRQKRRPLRHLRHHRQSRRSISRSSISLPFSYFLLPSFQFIHISVGEYVPAALYTEEKHRWDIINRHLEQGNFSIQMALQSTILKLSKASEASFKYFGLLLKKP